MNYTQLVTDLTTLLVVSPSDTSFQAILPALIDDAEQRIYRELDFLETRTTDSSISFTTNSRNVTLPSTIIVCEGISAITPVSTQPNLGMRNVLEHVSLDFIDSTWPIETGGGATGVPAMFAMKTDIIAVVAPTPDGSYVMEVTGTIRPAPISATNTTTWLGDHLPDLLLAACMVFGFGYLRDWGSASDDPQAAVSWEGHYQALKVSAMEEEQRRKSQGNGWTPYSATPQAPPRTG